MSDVHSEEYPDELTYRWMFEKLPSIQTKEEAEAMIEAIVDRLTPDPASMLSKKTNIAAVRHTIGYMSGYYDQETAERIWELFSTEHPIFHKTWPTWDEAFNMGKDLGKKYQDWVDAGRPGESPLKC